MRMIASTSRIATSRSTSSRGTTAIIAGAAPNGPPGMRSLPNCLRKAVYGTIAKSSGLGPKPPSDGRLSITPTTV